MATVDTLPVTNNYRTTDNTTTEGAPGSVVSVAPERQGNSIQVSVGKTAVFYARIGRRMMHGSADGKPTFDEVIITGLGLATKTAIGTASMIEQDQQGFIKSIETSFFPSLRGTGRRVPKVTITIVKNPAAPSMDILKPEAPAVTTKAA